MTEPSGERPSAERPSAERPSAERPSAERPSAERPSAERPSAERRWHFDYALGRTPGVETTQGLDLIVATEQAVKPERVRRVLSGRAFKDLTIDELVVEPPVFWMRLAATAPMAFFEVGGRLTAAGIKVRYVASATTASQCLGTPFANPPSTKKATAAKPWSARHEPIGTDPSGPGGWFLGPDGLNVERAFCGYGIGIRVAVIDDEVGQSDDLGLDDIVAVACELPDAKRYARHGSLCVGWAVGAKGSGVAGVAPGASARLYCIPKPGNEVFAFPLAVIRAVADGADVISCSTYIDGTTSPMLDDALEFAHRYGRDGRGTAVVLSASREMSSAEGRLRPSLTLDLGDPVSDPRVMCAAASGREGGWFLWRDKHGELNPFSNRGPAVRFMAPGDDVTDPLAPQRLSHAESSGATAFSVGVVALVLAHNPRLRVGELNEVLRVSATAIHPSLDRTRANGRAAGDAELRPFESDGDGHNAKHGYGRLNATHACIASRDPVALTLLLMGEGEQIDGWTRRQPFSGHISAAVLRTICAAILTDASVRHQCLVIGRHLRLLAARDPLTDSGAASRLGQQEPMFASPGALARLLTLLVRRVLARFGESMRDDRNDAELQTELRALTEALTIRLHRSEQRGALESHIESLARKFWAPDSAAALRAS